MHGALAPGGDTVSGRSTRAECWRSDMHEPKIVSRGAWLEARKRLLVKEKEFTRLRDELSQARRDLPWVPVEKDYTFEGPAGAVTLRELFEDRSQLITYHFMFDPSWQEGCSNCSFWADGYNGYFKHLNQRDVAFAVVSRAPAPKLQAFRTRMGWRFPWVSSLNSDFNYDFQVSFTADAIASGEITYNYARRKPRSTELPGLSVFCKDDHGVIFHTYSCYARGLDMLNGAYHHLDLVPKGRNEAGLLYPMAWVRLHDRYGG
jgi:predicted dithiol-disulfide oxidoreductase (DUF899 family)